MSDQPQEPTQEAPAQPSKRDLIAQEISQWQAQKEQALAQANFFEGRRQGAEDKLSLFDSLEAEKSIDKAIDAAINSDEPPVAPI